MQKCLMNHRYQKRRELIFFCTYFHLPDLEDLPGSEKILPEILILKKTRMNLTYPVLNLNICFKDRTGAVFTIIGQTTDVKTPNFL